MVTNDNIALLYLDRVLSTLQDFDVATVVLQDGENHKQIDLRFHFFRSTGEAIF